MQWSFLYKISSGRLGQEKILTFFSPNPFFLIKWMKNQWFWLPDPGYQILATRSWLSSSWLPDPGYQILAAKILATRSWLPDSGCRILAPRSWLPDPGCRILATRFWCPKKQFQTLGPRFYWSSVLMIWNTFSFCKSMIFGPQGPNWSPLWFSGVKTRLGAF